MSALNDQATAPSSNAQGKAPARCRFCTDPIPEERLRVLPGVDTCVDCQSDIERRAHFDWGMGE